MNIHETILHLSLIDGVGPAKIKQICDYKPDAFELTDLYTISVSDITRLFGFPYTVADAIVRGLSDRSLLERELGLIERHQFSWITNLDESYPPLLKEIHVPPAILYYRGAPLYDPVVGQTNMIAVVGARKANQYGQRVINQIVPELISRHWTIVSGGAFGIDTMAHKATVEVGGKTIAVLGSGLLCEYPHSNKRLFNEVVATGGTVMSAFSLQTEPLPGNFPARNRIIAGLSQGCLVVQAAEKSGARITAQYALEQGREVFAIPGQFDDELSAGCHALIQEGATLATSVHDIFAAFGHQQVKETVDEHLDQQLVLPGMSKKSQEKSVEPAHHYDKNSPEWMILQALFRPQTVDDLMTITQLGLFEMNAKLFELQLAGAVSQNFTGQWERKI
ncbi:MAG TPA: DNA-processing protein DprA [Candidatus Babeliales bacterium]|nr:DNA-processing protein DprA [Candidatus Babeliales bacterium]